jgi:hypothetical protein
MDTDAWKKCNANVFWGEIAPTDHIVQVYDTDDVVLDSLEGFAVSGLSAGDSVVIIATRKHLRALNKRLEVNGFDLEPYINTHQYMPLDAEETLSKFMVDGWPDEALFMQTVNYIIARAHGTNNRRVRAYGEMVAILWGQGYAGATVHLEHLWNRFCATEAFCLFCAYPKSGFTQDVNTSINHICSVHTMVVSGLERSKTEVFYKREGAA